MAGLLMQADLFTPPPQLNGQKATVLRFLHANGSITAADAWDMGIRRLAARIHELKDAGHRIEAVQDGPGVRYHLAGWGHDNS